MERTIEITECDVCGKKEKLPYKFLLAHGWTKYRYTKEWVNGTVDGVCYEKNWRNGVDFVEMCVCKNCDREKTTMRLLLKKIKKCCR